MVELAHLGTQHLWNISLEADITTQRVWKGIAKFCLVAHKCAFLKSQNINVWICLIHLYVPFSSRGSCKFHLEGSAGFFEGSWPLFSLSSVASQYPHSHGHKPFRAIHKIFAHMLFNVKIPEISTMYILSYPIRQSACLLTNLSPIC